jgi:hypothetical protein
MCTALRPIALTLLVATTALGGCASGPRPILGKNMFGSRYTPPLGKNRFKDHGMVIVVDKIANGPWGQHFFAQVTVRNLGTEEAVFDPAEIELLVPETGMTYSHITKDKTSVTVPLGYNLMGKTTLKPGRAVSGSLWFLTQAFEATAKTLQVSYKNQNLTFPPPEAVAPASKED